MGHEHARAAHLRQKGRGRFSWAAKSRSIATIPKTRQSKSTTKYAASSPPAYKRARNILETHRDALERVAQALLDREVLDATELKLLMEGKPLPDKPLPPPPSAPPVPSKEPQLSLRPEPRAVPGMAKGEKPAPA